jgi:hypothetical protein
LDQSGWAWVPLTDLFLRVLTGGTQTQRLNSFFVSSQQLRFVLFGVFGFFFLQGWPMAKAGPSHLWSATKCILCCAALRESLADGNGYMNSNGSEQPQNR